MNGTIKKIPYLSPTDLRSIGDEMRDFFEKNNYASWIVSEGLPQQYLESKLHAGAKILDISCCTGDFMKAMKERGFDVWGTDIDYYLRYPELKDRFVAMDASMETYPYEDNFFDAVTLLEAMDHLENPYHAFREIHRILKPGGIFICSGSNAFSLWNRLKFLRRSELFEWREASNHVSPMTKGVLKKSLFRLFELDKMAFDHGYIPHMRMVNAKFKRHMPRHELVSKHAAYFLTKKEKEVPSLY